MKITSRLGFSIVITCIFVASTVVLGYRQGIIEVGYKPGPYANPDDWVIVMEDDFDGETLNESIWSRGYPPCEWNCWGQCHNHQGWFAPENVIVQDGLLRIKGENKTHPDAPAEHYWGDKNLPLNYTSGAITSFGKLEFKYGYLEARQRMPAGPTGFWPAFWTINSEGPGYGEIDIQEWLSGEDLAYHVTVHTAAPEEPLKSQGTTHHAFVNLTAGFHFYGVEWHPDRLSFFFDGKEVFRLTDPDDLEHLHAQHVRINLAIGGWASAPDENTAWPAYFDTDYVRLWQYKEYL